MTSEPGQGIAIAWWRRALHGKPIDDLNTSWQFSSSLKQIAFNLKAFNIIALTALVTKMTMIDSTLFQKAIGTYTKVDWLGQKQNSVYGYINQTFPSTGMGTLSSLEGHGLQDWFNQDLEIWQTGGGAYPNQFETFATPFGGARSSMAGTVRESRYYNGSLAYVQLDGAGLQFDCLKSTTEWIDVSSLAFPSTANATVSSTQTLFDISFSVHRGIVGSAPDGPNAWINNTDYIIMEVAHTTSEDDGPEDDARRCPSRLTRQTCRLRAAVVSYPIELSQRGDEETWTARIGTDRDSDYETDPPSPYGFNETGKQQNYFDVKRVLDLSDFPYAVPSANETYFGNSTYGGLVLGLQTYLGGFAQVYKVDNTSSYDIYQNGSSQSYLENLPARGSCTYGFADPLEGGRDLLAAYSSGPDSKFIDPGLIGKINSIMFGLATDVSGLDPNNDFDKLEWYPASIWADAVHFETHFWYMGGAAASTIVCLVLILPSYYGFWQLDHKVSLGPFEITAAVLAKKIGVAKSERVYGAEPNVGVTGGAIRA